MTDQILATINEIDWRTSMSMINTVAFIAYSLDEYSFSYNQNLKQNERDSLRYSALLLAIAGGHYAILDVNKPTVRSEILIRYSDWLLTTPLLLLSLTSYYNIDSKKAYELVAYDILMIVFGLVYELTGNIQYWYIGTAAYLVLAYRLYQFVPETDLFYRYFIVGWGLYGVVSLMPAEKRLIYYNVLDFYNKLVFAIDIRNKITKNLLMSVSNRL